MENKKVFFRGSFEILLTVSFLFALQRPLVPATFTAVMEIQRVKIP